MIEAVDEEVKTKLLMLGTLVAALTAARVCWIVPLMTFSGSGSRVRSDALHPVSQCPACCSPLSTFNCRETYNMDDATSAL